MLSFSSFSFPFQSSTEPRGEQKKGSQQAISHKNIHHFESEILLYANTKTKGKAFQLFKDMQRAGITPTKTTYDAIIGLCLRLNYQNKALRIVKSMRKKGYPPVDGDYTKLIQLFIKAKNEKKVFEIFAMMQEDDMKIRSVTYQKIIQLFIETENADKALLVFNARVKNRIQEKETSIQMAKLTALQDGEATSEHTQKYGIDSEIGSLASIHLL